VDTADESLGTLLVGRMASDKLNFHITPSEASVTPIDASSDQGTPAPERAICARVVRRLAARRFTGSAQSAQSRRSRTDLTAPEMRTWSCVAVEGRGMAHLLDESPTRGTEAVAGFRRLKRACAASNSSGAVMVDTAKVQGIASAAEDATPQEARQGLAQAGIDLPSVPEKAWDKMQGWQVMVVVLGAFLIVAALAIILIWKGVDLSDDDNKGLVAIGGTLIGGGLSLLGVGAASGVAAAKGK
jgi:hypothetical protein